jgi:hypothetical protein
MKKHLFLMLAMAMFLFMAPVKEAGSQRLDLSSFIIDTYGDKLMARFSIEIENFEKIKTALDNGSKVALLCDVSLLRNRALIWDVTLGGTEIEVGLEKDLLSGDYKILFPHQTISLSNFEESDFLDQFKEMKVELVPLEKLEAGQRYVVRIQVKLISKGVPKWIKRTLFFWSWDLARSIRYDMEFSL